MNKILFLVLIMIPATLSADLYDEAMKLEAKGNYELSIVKFRQYFDENINDDNQHGIIEKLIYASTLFSDIEDSLSFLEYYVKFMRNENSRYRVYKKIGEIYELSGSNINAGIYYEKAAYTLDNQIDYFMLFESLDILIESGYYNKAIKKLLSINEDEVGSIYKDRYYYSLSRAYYRKNEYEKSNKYLEHIKIKDSRYWFLLSVSQGNSRGINRYKESIEYLVLKSDVIRLRNPSDYIGIKPDFSVITKKSFDDNDNIEICLGTYNSRYDASGIINLLEQIEINWFFDKVSSGETLYIFTDNEAETKKKLDKLGIYYE